MSSLVRDLGENVTEMVEVAFPKLHKRLSGPFGAKRPGSDDPKGIVQFQMNGPPVVTKQRKFVVASGLIVAFLAVALDAHGLVVPVSVATLL